MVEHPTRQGFGSKLLNRIVTRNLGGVVTIDYAETGLRAKLSLPL